MSWPSKDPADYRDGRESRSLFEGTRALTAGLVGAAMGLTVQVAADLTHLPVFVIAAVMVSAALLWLRHRRRARG